MNKQIDYLGNIGIVVADWNIESSFKPRTLTTDYNTWITYISRKGVPAGIEITNTEYWKPIVRLNPEIVEDYNNLKEELRRNLQEFEDGIEEDYQGIKDDYARLKADNEATWASFKQACMNAIETSLDEVIKQFSLSTPEKIDSLFI